MTKIDFVVLWVDGNDPEWREERKKCEGKEFCTANNEARYREWDLMRYWFRGVEKFAPWVNKVYFVTWGHRPDWLNTEHPKLEIVRHEDYIPKENLPTFNSNVIELYLNRIPALSERFVLFSDDTFLTGHVSENDFFREGHPCDTACLSQNTSACWDDLFPHTILNNMAVINKHFKKKEVMRKHWKEFFCLKYGKDMLRNILLLPGKNFVGFRDTHLPSSHLKSTFSEVWEVERDVLERCGKNRFRSWDDVTHWLMKYWMICQGKVAPRRANWGRFFKIGQFREAARAIERQTYKAVCVNDDDTVQEIGEIRARLAVAFESILPEKCGFEK